VRPGRTRAAALAAAAAVAFCRAACAGSGTTAASFLLTDLGARSVGMAGAFTAVADDNEALFHNPAGLALLSRTEAELGYISAPAGASYQHFSFAHPIGRTWTTALGFNYSTTGSIGRTDAAGADIGSYAGTGLVGELAAAKDLGRGLRLGGGAKVVRQTLDDRAATVSAFDAGLLYDYQRLRLGAAVKDAGPDVKLLNDASPLPRTMKFGASYRLRQGLVFAADALQTRGDAWQGALGGELRLKGTDTIDYLAFRLGYKLRGLDQGAGPDITGGFGVLIAHSYALDLAFLPFGDMGTLSVVSLSARFGSGRAAAAVAP
jgi:hypothetical protein